MRRLGQRTLEFDRPTILSHGAVGGKREAEGPLGGDFDQTFGDTTLQEEQLGKGRGTPPKGGRHLGIGKGRPLPPRGGLHPGGGFAQPVHLLHLWAAGLRHPLPGAVRGLLHHGPNAAAGLHSGGERRCGKGPGGDKLPLLLGRAPVPPAFGVRRPARPHCPVDRHRGGLRVGGPGREGPGGPGPGGRHPGFGREGPRQHGGGHGPPRRPPACTSSSRIPAPPPGTTTASSPGIWARWAPSCCTSAWRTTMWTCAPSTRTAACSSTTASARTSTPGARAAAARPRCCAATFSAAWSAGSCGTSFSAPPGL